MWTQICRFVVLVSAVVIVVDAEQQSFVDAPTNTTVVQGQTVILRCSVANRKGAVQWTKDGIALGFSRTIPGYPRYRMIGDESLDEFHLEIANSTFGDEAVFQCQVAPGAGDSALIGSAHLLVTVAPTDASIDGYVNNSVISVDSAQRSMTLTCWCRAAKPPPTITWLRNDVIVTSPAPTSGVTLSTAAGGPLWDAWSVVLVEQLRPELSGVIYTCRCENSASTAPSDFVVRLHVRAPPSAPTISGYEAGQRLNVGDEVALECTAPVPGGALSWYRSGGASVDERPLRSTCKTTTTTTTAVGEVTTVCRLTLVVRRDHNSAVYTCSASYNVTSVAMTSSIQLTVLYRPQGVTISGARDVISGERLTLTCKTTTSNPEAEITWYDARGRQLTSSVTSEIAATTIGFVTTSNVTLTTTTRDNDASYECRAANIATPTGQYVVASTTLSVLFGPSAARVRFTPAVLRAGSTATLTCEAVNANPPAHVTWWSTTHDGRLESRMVAVAVNESRLAAEHGGVDVVSRVQVVLDSDDDGKTVACFANGTRTVTSQLQLRVRYKPVFTMSTSSSSYKVAVLERQVASINVTAVANPASVVYSWYSGKLLDKFVASGPLLTLENVTRHQAGSFICVASNSEGSTTLPVILDVQFAAEIVNMTSNQVVNETSPVTLECVVGANPVDVLRITWYRVDDPDPDVELAGSKVEVVASVATSRLFIAHASSSNGGLYRCVAFNGLGAQVNATANVFVIPTGVASSQRDDEVMLIVVPSTIVGAVLLVVVIVLLTVFIYRRRRRSLPQRHNVFITEKKWDEKASSIVDYNSSSNPVEIITRDGQPALVRWTSSELDSHSKTELMSSVGSRSDQDAESMTNERRAFVLASVLDDTCQCECDNYSGPSVPSISGSLPALHVPLHVERSSSVLSAPPIHVGCRSSSSDGIHQPIRRTQTISGHVPQPPRQISSLQRLNPATAGHRLYGDVVSEEDDAANYSQHLRELQNYITQPQSATNQLSFSTNALSVPEKTAQRRHGGPGCTRSQSTEVVSSPVMRPSQRRRYPTEPIDGGHHRSPTHSRGDPSRPVMSTQSLV